MLCCHKVPGLLPQHCSGASTYKPKPLQHISNFILDKLINLCLPVTLYTFIAYVVVG